VDSVSPHPENLKENAKECCICAYEIESLMTEAIESINRNTGKVQFHREVSNVRQ
jgi:hypothetical protein